MRRTQMQLIAPPVLAAGFFVAYPPTRDAIGPTLVLVAKAEFTLAADGRAIPSESPATLMGEKLRGEPYAPIDPLAECLYPGDYVPPKPRAEVLVVGACHAAAPATQLPAKVALGAWSKTIFVFGERVWHKGFLQSKPGDPGPFVTMPLSWQQAFGGPDDPANPVGKGRDGHSLPNLESPSAPIQKPREHPPAANFGPINAHWPARKKYLGTYDKRWLAERWPAPPADFAAEFFNAAPADQWLPSPLVGNEPFVLEFLHPDVPHWSGHLPGWRVTASVARPSGGAAEAVTMALDTVFIDTESRRLTLTWRGLAAIENEFLGDVSGIAFAVESLVPGAGVPVPNVPANAASPSATDAAIDSAMSWARRLRTHPIIAATDAPPSVNRRVAAWFADAEALEKQALAAGQPLAARDVAAAMGEVKTVLGRVRESDARIAADLETEIAHFTATGRFAPYLAAATPPLAPTRSPKEIAAILAAGETLANADLRGADLAGIDLSKRDLSGAVLIGAYLDGANLAGANLRGAVMANASLTRANLADADLSDADFTNADLSLADLSRATLAHADFSRAVLDGAKLAHAAGGGALFFGASAIGAVATVCDLPGSTWIGANLTDANFDGAQVLAATWERVTAPRVSAQRAIVGDLRAGDGSDFAGGDFRGISADGSIWTDANLAGAIFRSADLARADFSRANLEGADFAGASAVHARFLQAVLRRASLMQANGLRANFDSADLAGADLSGANCYEAEFLHATTDGAKLAGCVLTGTKLE